jgi:hypothetical protein
MREPIDMREQTSRPSPLEEFESLDEARAALEHLEGLRAVVLPVVLIGLIFGAGVAWLDAQMVAWGADPAISRAPFNYLVLLLWTANAIAAFQFLMLAWRCWALRTSIDHYFDEFLATVGERRDAA